MGTLFVIATPIGNLSDLSDRVRTSMASVDLLLCEDTRVTRKMLSALEIHVPTASLHQHSSQTASRKYIDLLREGKTLGLVTDAGTPAISDPGAMFVADVLKELGDSVRIEAIPGPSALITALSISGFPADTFTFLGFPPHKKGRTRFFDELALVSHTVVFYESVHRVEKALEELERVAPHRKLLLARELTKMHETLYRGTPSEVAMALKAGVIKGECVIVLAPLKK